MSPKLNLSGPKKKWALTRRGLVLYIPSIPATGRFTREETEVLLGKQDWDKLDEHCEIAHIEITPNCNRSCVYCYNPKNEPELSTADLFKVFQNLAKANVFQITFGGGEPFTRKDVFELAAMAKGLGLNVCATTNGDLLEKWCYHEPFFTEDALKAFGQVNISYHGAKDFYSNLEILGKRFRESGVKLGINFCCQDRYVSQLEDVAKAAEQHHAELLLLAYKPVRDVDITGLKPEEVKAKAIEIANRYKLDVAVDGACAGTCHAALRFCDIHANGDVSVCSFRRESIGNLLKEDFIKVWHSRPKDVTCPYFEGVKNNPSGTEPL